MNQTPDTIYKILGIFLVLVAQGTTLYAFMDSKYQRNADRIVEIEKQMIIQNSNIDELVVRSLNNQEDASQTKELLRDIERLQTDIFRKVLSLEITRRENK